MSYSRFSTIPTFHNIKILGFNLEFIKSITVALNVMEKFIGIY